MERATEKPTEVMELADEHLDQVTGGWSIPTSLLLNVKWPKESEYSGTCNVDGTYTP
jgi:hypothetical protein